MANGSTSTWKEADWKVIEKIARQHTSRKDAAVAIGKALGREVTDAALDGWLLRKKKPRLAQLLKVPTVGGGNKHAFWTSRIAEAEAIAKRHSAVPTALAEMSSAFGKTITRYAIDHALSSAGKPRLLQLLKKSLSALKTVTTSDVTIENLFNATKKGARDFAELCDELDIAPKKLHALIEEAKLSGNVIKTTGNHVGFDLDPADANIHEMKVKIAPVIGKRQMVGVISDTHLGSKYCLRAQLIDAIEYFYSRGVRTILHPGDILDGCYSFARHEWSHVGLEEQTEDLFEVLPKKKDLRYLALSGNHDESFTEKSGVDVPKYIENYFKNHGRDDFAGVGRRSVFIEVGGAIINLWHPGGGSSYAKSYGLQKRIEGYSSSGKPRILLAGHWHIFCYLEDRGIHAIACPTFQGTGSQYSRSLKGTTSIGGLLLSWDLTKDGTLRDFILEKRSYFEREQPIKFDEQEEAPERTVERGDTRRRPLVNW